MVLKSAVAFALVLALSGCVGGAGDTSPTSGTDPGPEGSAEMTITIVSPAFDDGGPIPPRHTGDGEDVSPALAWSGISPETQELALVVDDPDAPRSEPWVHWLVYAIPTDVTGLAEGAGSRGGGALPPGAQQGMNDFGAIGYGGPAPPRGHGVHRYRFTLYALDVRLEAPDGLDKPALLAAMEGHILAQGELMGTYER